MTLCALTLSVLGEALAVPIFFPRDVSLSLIISLLRCLYLCVLTPISACCQGHPAVTYPWHRSRKDTGI